MNDWNIFQLIKERPDPMMREDVRRCPFCKSEKVKVNGSMTTLLGWSGPVNPNHITEDCACGECGKEFNREVKELNVWYTQKRKVLAGIPSCFENYVYTCSHCNGEVYRQYWNLEKTDKAKVLSAKQQGGKWVKDYRIFYACESCKMELETDQDHWS